MRKNNKDYKPWNEYVERQKHKRAIAQAVAAWVHSLTAHQHIDIDMLVGALQRSLWPTWRAAEELGLSARAFLRLRRKYGLEPIHKLRLSEDPRKMKYLYSKEQLTRIPPLEVERSKRRSALARERAAKKSEPKPVINAGLDLERIYRRTG